MAFACYFFPYRIADTKSAQLTAPLLDSASYANRNSSAKGATYRSLAGFRLASGALPKQLNIHLELVSRNPRIGHVTKQIVEPLRHHIQGCHPLTMDQERIRIPSKAEA